MSIDTNVQNARTAEPAEHKATAAGLSSAPLSDTAMVLLSTASNRDDGAILPSPVGLKTRGGALKAVLNHLLARNLVEEVPVKSDAESWRRDDEAGRIGLRISLMGSAAIGIEADTDPIATASDGGSVAEAGAVSSSTRLPSKQDQILALLSREEGATVDALRTATGWLPHTVRAMLSGLRKKGHRIDRQKDGDAGSVYRILSSPDVASIAATSDAAG